MISGHFITREYIDILFNTCVIFCTGPVTYIYIQYGTEMDASTCVRVSVCVYRGQRF